MKNCREKIALLGIFLLSVLVHLLPFFLYGKNPLGYDTGFYRRYLIQPFVSFPNTAVPGLGNDALIPRIILDALRLLHIPTDIALYGSYILFSALLPILLYFLMRNKTGKKNIAYISAILLTLSPIQYASYWFMFWKNAWAFCLVLLAYILFERKYFWLVVLTDILIAFSHKTTSVVFISSLVFALPLVRNRWKEILLHIVVTSLSLIAIYPKITGVISNAPVAVFMSLSEYLNLSTPIIALAVIGIVLFIKKKALPPATCFILGSAIFTVLQTPFYERTFVFLDLGIIILASYGVYHILSFVKNNRVYSYRTLVSLILCLLFGVLIGKTWLQINSYSTLINDLGIKRIEEINKITGAGAYILTTTDEAPWFEGWTEAHIFAPGMLWDTHNLDEWNAFWGTSSVPFRKQFLKDFPKPLYIATLNDFNNLIGEKIDCLSEITSDLLRDNCSY